MNTEYEQRLADDAEARAVAPDWAITFADMMSLLLAFFVMLASISEVQEEERFQAMAHSLRRQFGHAPTSAAETGSLRPRNTQLAAATSGSRTVRSQLLHIAAAPAEMPDSGEIDARSSLLFANSTVALTRIHKQQLDVLAANLDAVDQQIEVRSDAAHNQPPTAALQSDSQEVAYLRAKAVAEYLRRELAIAPERVRITIASDERRHTAAQVEVLLLDRR